VAAEGSYRAHLLFRKLRSPPGTQKRRGRRYFSYGQPYRQGYARCLRFVDTVDATDSSDCPDANLTRPALASPRLVDTASNMSCRSHQSLCRGCGVELSRGLTSSEWNVEAPRHVSTPGVALFRLWTGAKAASRPMLAFRERDERVGCVGSSGHPKRVSL